MVAAYLCSTTVYAVCPGGEGAALKAVGLKGLAGSNPVDGAIGRKTINPWRRFALFRLSKSRGASAT